MNKLFRHRLFARLLILFCLLLYTGTSQAIWCTGENGNAHLKLSTIGSATLPCHGETQKHQFTDEAKVARDAALPDMGKDCSHIRAYDSVISSTNQDSFKPKPVLSFFVAPNFLCGFAQNLPEIAPQSRLHALQLPPLQALTALRTVILLC